MIRDCNVMKKRNRVDIGSQESIMIGKNLALSVKYQRKVV